MDIIFFGTDHYSAVALETLLRSDNYRICAVVTDRPKPKDRDQVITPNPVEKLAVTQSINVAYYPDDLAKLDTKDAIGVIASFGHIIPAHIMAKFPHGILNIHPSLLPQYRGVAPVPYAIAMGDNATGVTVFKIDAGVDTGRIVAQTEAPILAGDTSPILLERLFALGSKLVIDYLSGSPAPRLSAPPSIPSVLIYSHRFTRDSGYLEWPILQDLLANKSINPSATNNSLLKLRLERNSSHPRSMLTDLIRALLPWPGVWTTAKTSKGEWRVSFVDPGLSVLIAGKPKPISWQDFEKYYIKK